MFFDELKKAAECDSLRLHTPGHKGSLCTLDLTELADGSFPADGVLRAESYAAQAYGAKHARYLCCGSSQGVKAAIFYAACNAVVDVNSHRAVFDGFVLSGKTCITTGEKGSIKPLDVKRIDAALTPDIKAVVVTTPTYYGYSADIIGISEYCKRKGLLFIADGAHGAHFGFSEYLPQSAAPIADICNMSAHKTLSSLTQSALLFDNLCDDSSVVLGKAVDIMGSTSPSYLLYASIDDGVRKVAGDAGRRAYAELFAPISELKREFPFLDNDDFTRPVLDVAALGTDANKLNAALAARGVFSEKADGRYIVFIFTAENTPSDVMRLSETLNQSLRELK